MCEVDEIVSKIFKHYSETNRLEELQIFLKQNQSKKYKEFIII